MYLTPCKCKGRCAPCRSGLHGLGEDATQIELQRREVWLSTVTVALQLTTFLMLVMGRRGKQ
jgi:hypothetical protein